MKIWPIVFLLSIIVSLYSTAIIVVAVYSQHGLMATVAVFTIPALVGWLALKSLKTDFI